MAYSSDPAAQAKRGFVPPRSEEEQLMMRRAQDLFSTAERSVELAKLMQREVCRATADF